MQQHQPAPAKTTPHFLRQGVTTNTYRLTSQPSQSPRIFPLWINLLLSVNARSTRLKTRICLSGHTNSTCTLHSRNPGLRNFVSICPHENKSPQIASNPQRNALMKSSGSGMKIPPIPSPSLLGRGKFVSTVPERIKVEI